MKKSANSRAILLAAATALLLPGCATSPTTPATGGVTDGRKNIQLAINPDSNLDIPGDHGDLEFSAEFLSVEEGGGGTKIFTVRLKPYENWEGLSLPVPLYRIHPVPSTVKFRSKRLNNLPLANLDFSLGVPSTGKASRLILNYTHITRVQLKSKTSKRAQITISGKGNTSYTIDNVDVTQAHRFSGPPPADDNDSAWEASTLSWLPTDPKEGFDLGDGGGDLYMDSKGWHLEAYGAGPEASDYSYLETQSKREDFD